MHKVPLRDAEKPLRRLLDEAVQGEEGVITRGDGAFFKRVPLSKQKPRLTFGSSEGEIWMSEDVDAPLEDVEDDMPGRSARK